MSAGSIVGGIVGGVAGFFVGGPAGAAIGFGIGVAAGGLLDSPKGPSQPGPQINDKNFQTAKYGDQLSRFHGTIGGHGNVTWIEGGKLKPTIRKKKSGGKGSSSKASVPVVTYSATFLLSLGVGPIAGVRRIWCSDKLIYNAGSDDLETIIASNQAASGWKLYLGTDDQLPDPRYEADVGVGNAPAYRGEAYIAFYDFQLADYSNTLQGAQFKVEVVTLASTSVALAGQYSASFTQPHSNIAFSPKPYFVSDEKIVFYVPQWENDFPSSSSFLVYEFYPSGLKRTYSIPVTGITSSAVPPNGDTDRDDEFWPGAVFTAPGNFSGSDGYQQRRGDLYAGVSDNSGRKLYIRSYDSLLGVQPQFSVSTGAACFAIVNDSVYTFTPDGIRIYDSSANLLSTHLFALPSMTYPEARAEYVDGEFLLFSGGVSPKLYRINEGLDGYELIASIPINSGDAYYSISVNLSKGIVVRANPGNTPKTLYVQWYNIQSLTGSNASLASVIEAEVELSSLLTAADVDVSEITDSVRGYRVQGGSIRSALEPLQGAFPFDVIPSGYQIKCVPRGQASVVTIPWQNLGASDSEPGDLLQRSREMDSQLPAWVAIKYLDAAREYAIAEQLASRDNTPAINRVDRELPLVLNADEAAGVADVLLNLPWLEREDFSFSLPPIYLHLEPADVITVAMPYASFDLRLTEINYSQDGRLECKAKLNRAALYNPAALGSEGVPPTGTIPLAGPTVWLPLDIPVVDETIQNSPGFVSVALGYSAGWPGAVAFRSTDSGQTWVEVQGYTGVPSIGYARGTLPASSGTLIDQRTLTVDVIVGELESITRDQMLSGQNYAAYGADGRWEIVRFQNAVLQSDGSYLISHFVRGDSGTEWATGLHQAGDWFVPLDDPDNVFVDMAIGSIGIPATYRGVTSGASIDSAPDVPFTYQGVNLECLSPVNAKGSRDGSGNFTGTFTRRSRLSSTWWTNGVQAPVGETAEAYEIDVMSGSTVVRTINSSTTSFSYTAAQQTTDFGSAQASITFRIYQLSEVVGRGYVREVTL